VGIERVSVKLRYRKEKIVMKRRIGIMIIFCMLLSVSSVFSLEIIGTLSYWYSNSSSIDQWEFTPTYSIYRAGYVPATKAQTMSSAFSTWEYYANVKSSYTASNGNITGYIYNRNDIRSLVPTLPDIATAVTYNGRSYTGQGFDTSMGIKNYYTMTYSKIYVVNESAGDMTYFHEVGHALGWEGHSSNSNDVMYGNAAYRNATGLSSRDINHLKQIY